MLAGLDDKWSVILSCLGSSTNIDIDRELIFYDYCMSVRRCEKQLPHRFHNSEKMEKGVGICMLKEGSLHVECMVVWIYKISVLWDRYRSKDRPFGCLSSQRIFRIIKKTFYDCVVVIRFRGFGRKLASSHSINQIYLCSLCSRNQAFIAYKSHYYEKESITFNDTISSTRKTGLRIFGFLWWIFWGSFIVSGRNNMLRRFQ